MNESLIVTSRPAVHTLLSQLVLSDEDSLIRSAWVASEQSMLRWGSGLIGNRRTPYRSNWPMRDKWKKFGLWWTRLGNDGDVLTGVNGLVLPMVLQLFYVVEIDGTVTQLCWERFDIFEEWRDKGKEPPLDIIGQHMKIKYDE